jgi:hypothetical protein
MKTREYIYRGSEEMYLLNAFSLNMLAEYPAQPLFEEVSLDQVRNSLQNGFTSAVGHADTAAVFSDQLGINVPANRTNVSLVKGDIAVIGQYRGPRLPEGVSTLPEGASIVWLQVTI